VCVNAARLGGGRRHGTGDSRGGLNLQHALMPRYRSILSFYYWASLFVA